MEIFRCTPLLSLFLAVAFSAYGVPRDCKPIRANRAKTIVVETQRMQSSQWARGDTTLVRTTRDGKYRLVVRNGLPADTLFVSKDREPAYTVATRYTQIVAPYIVYTQGGEEWTDTLNAQGSGGGARRYFDGNFESSAVHATTNTARRSLRYYRRAGTDSAYLVRHANGAPQLLVRYDAYGADSLTQQWSEDGVLTMRRAAQRHDERTYYPDGVLQTHRYDTSGPLGYCHKEYHPSGALKAVAFFQEGEPAGTWRHYGADGHLLRTEKKKRAIDSLMYGVVEAAPPPPEIPTIVDQMHEASKDFGAVLAQQLDQVLCRSRVALDGKYTVIFIVDEAGKLITTGAAGQNAEAIAPDLKAVFAALPAWRPRRLNGRPMRSKMALYFKVAWQKHRQ